MQGRLLPKYRGRFQAHPVGTWSREFELASIRGLDCIEFILDFERAAENPLTSELGSLEIAQIATKTSVSVSSICGDYFMVAPLHSEIQKVRQKSIETLVGLMETAEGLNVSDIVIPCVDNSSLAVDSARKPLFIEAILEACRLSKNKKVNLALETDLDPVSFASLLAEINISNVTVNYDIGNSAAFGFDVDEEFAAYGDSITNVHIKDRLLGGPSVPLGSGNADISKVFKKLSAMSFSGLLIMQAFRDEEGLKIFDEQFSWIKKELALLFD